VQFRLKHNTSVFQSLAWPALIAFVVWLFRVPISKKIEELAEIPTKQGVVAFRNKVAEATALASQKTPGQLGLPLDISDIIDAMPNLAIVRIWAALEHELGEALKKAYRWSDPDSSVNIRCLQRAGHIDSDDAQSLFLMRAEQKRAASRLPSLDTPVDVPQYRKVAEYLIDKLQKSARKEET
jgi:hypothetical protein